MTVHPIARFRLLLVTSGVVALAMSAACNRRDSDGPPMSPKPLSTPESIALPVAAAEPMGGAVAELNPTQGSDAAGTVRITAAGEDVRVTIEMHGLVPGPHGFHIHEHGDCSAPDASSAGKHFNPAAMPHGAPDAVRRHAGDFGNLEADASGHAQAEFLADGLSFEGASSVIGRAAVVHTRRDDLTTQPSGDSGTPVACGVIQADSTIMKVSSGGTTTARGAAAHEYGLEGARPTANQGRRAGGFTRPRPGPGTTRAGGSRQRAPA